MASRLASQLQALAQSRKSLPPNTVRKQPSFLFEAHVASRYDHETIFSNACEALQQLIEIDGRFRPFTSSLFRAGAWQIDIDVAPQEDVVRLLTQAEKMLPLLSANFLLTPTHNVIEYLVRQYRVQNRCRDAFLCMALPYHESPMFHRIVALVNLTDDWVFLKPSFQKDEGYARSMLVNRACTHASFFQIVLQIASRSAELAKTGSSNHAGVTFASAIVSATIERKAVKETHLRFLLPFLHKALNHKKTFCVELRSLAESVSIAVSSFLSASAVNALVTSVITGIDSDANVQQVQKQLKCAANIFKCRRPDWPLPEKAFNYAIEVDCIVDAFADIKSSPELKSFVESFIAYLIQRGNLALATALITKATDASSDYLQRCIDLAMASQQDVDKFRRDLGFGFLDQFRHPDAHIRLSAFTSLEKQVTRGDVTLGAASTVYFECLNDESVALVAAVLRSPTTLSVVDVGTLCTVVRRALKRFDSQPELVRCAVQALARSDRDECAVLLIDIAISNPDALAHINNAQHALFKNVDSDSLCRTLANGTNASSLALVLEVLRSRPALLPVFELLSKELISQSITEFIGTLEIIGSGMGSSTFEFDAACTSIAQTTADIDTHRLLFALASKLGAYQTVSYIRDAHSKAIFSFLSSLWEDPTADVSSIVSAIDSVSKCLPKKNNVSFLIPHLLSVICHEDERVRAAVLSALVAIKPLCRSKYKPLDNEPLSPSFLCETDFDSFLDSIISSSKEINIDRFWVQKIPVDTPVLTALIKSCNLLHNDHSRISLLSSIRFEQIEASLIEEAAKLVNVSTCHILLPKIAASQDVLLACKSIFGFLDSKQPVAIIRNALRVLNPSHYECLPNEDKLALLLRLTELLVTDLASTASDALSNLKVSGDIAAAVMRPISDTPRQIALLRVWANIDIALDPSSYVVALFEMLDSPSTDPIVIGDILKSLLNVKNISEIAANADVSIRSLVERTSCSRDACAHATVLLSSLASSNSSSVKDLIMPALTNIIPFLTNEDTFVSSVLINALQVFIPIHSKQQDILDLFVGSWARLPCIVRENIFYCLVSNLNNLGSSTVQLISKFGPEAFRFVHALFGRFSAPDQIVGLADMLHCHGSGQPSKRRKQASKPMPPVLSFIALRLDHSSFVSSLINSVECNNAFVRLYDAVLSEPESEWLDAIIKNVIAVASLPSFVSNLGALMQSISKENETLRRRALQLLNDKLEAVCEAGCKNDEIVPAVDVLLPHLITIIKADSEPDMNKQLSLLVIDALSALCPDDVVAPFIGAIPEILAIIPRSSAELRSSALMTLGSVIAMLGPHSLKFLSSVMPVVLEHVVTLQATALSTICAIVTTLPKFLAPHMLALFEAILSPSAIHCEVTEQIFKRLASGVPPRVLVSSITQFKQPHEKLLDLLRTVVVDFMSAADVKAHNRAIFQLCLKSFDSGISAISDHAVSLFTSLAVRLNETQLSGLYTSILEWAGPSSESSETRHTCLFAILDGLLDTLEVLIVPYVHQVIDLINGALSSKTASPRMVSLALDILRKTCQHDDGNLVSKPRFDAILSAFVNRIKFSCANRLPAELKKFEKDHLVPCAATLAATFEHEMYWKPMAHELLQLTRNSKPGIRHAAFVCLHGMMNRLGEPLLVILPEMLPYISEALEDDDTEVESAVRDLISVLEQLSGESMQDYLK